MTIALQATGRQVPIALVNMITNQPVANATIDAAGTNATTNSKGMVSIVLPANKLVVNGTISANGYNNELVGIHISSAPTVSQNTFQLTPSGRVYFLSNATGTIDVVSTNLDGTNKKIVLQGTGNESPQSTSLIPSADQQYLAFQAQRSSSSSVTTLYGISTNNGHLFTIDQGTNVSFQPEGWINHYFVYVETNNSVSNWQSGQQILKSYNADTGKLVTLDQTNGVGTDSNNYAQQQFTAVNLTNDSVIYAKTWDIYSVYATTLQGKQNSIYSIQPNATNKVDLHDIQVSAASLQYYYGYIQSIQTTPKTIYYQVPTNNYSSYSYLEYNNGTITQPQNYTQTNFNQQTSTYQGLSASGLRSLYTASRDGELAVIIGDQNGNNQKQIALLGGGYSLVGWYGNDYILLSKSSTLYVLSATGQGQPIRISPYLQTLGPGYA